jgi:hypothetical protein
LASKATNRYAVRWQGRKCGEEVARQSSLSSARSVNEVSGAIINKNKEPADTWGSLNGLPPWASSVWPPVDVLVAAAIHLISQDLRPFDVQF